VPTSAFTFAPSSSSLAISAKLPAAHASPSKYDS
jgi:hypothetical protein